MSQESKDSGTHFNHHHTPRAKKPKVYVQPAAPSRPRVRTKPNEMTLSAEHDISEQLLSNTFGRIEDRTTSRYINQSLVAGTAGEQKSRLDSLLEDARLKMVAFHEAHKVNDQSSHHIPGSDGREESASEGLAILVEDFTAIASRDTKTHQQMNMAADAAAVELMSRQTVLDNERDALKLERKRLEHFGTTIMDQQKAFEVQKKAFSGEKQAFESEKIASKSDKSYMESEKEEKEDLRRQAHESIDALAYSRRTRDLYFDFCAKYRGEEAVGFRGWQQEIDTFKALQDGYKNANLRIQTLESEQEAKISVYGRLKTDHDTAQTRISVLELHLTNKDEQIQLLIRQLKTKDDLVTGLQREALDHDMLVAKRVAEVAKEKVNAKYALSAKRELEVTLDGVESDLQAEQLRVGDLEKENKARKLKITKLQDTLKDVNSGYAKLETKYQKAHTEIDKVQLEKTKEESRVKDLTKENQEQKSVIRKIQQGQQSTDILLKNMENKFQTAQNQRDKLQDGKLKDQSLVKELTREIEEHQSKQGKLHESLDMANARCKQLETDVRTKTVQFATLQRQKEAVDNNLSNMAQYMKDAKSGMASLEDRNKDKAGIIQRNTDTITQLREEIESLEDTHALSNMMWDSDREHLLQGKELVDMELAQVKSKLDDSLSDQALLRLELADMENESKAKEEANASMIYRLNELEEDSMRHHRNWKLCDSELSGTSTRASNLEVKLADMTNRVLFLDEKLASEVDRGFALEGELIEQQKAFIAELGYAVGIASGYPFDVLRRLSFPQEDVTITGPTRQCLLDKNISTVHGKPTQLLVEKDGNFGTPTLHAIIRVALQLERQSSVIDMDSLLWHVWNTVESYHTAFADDRNIVFMPLLHLVRLVAQGYRTGRVSEFGLWQASQIACSIFRWKPDGFTITDLFSETHDTEVLELSVLARLQWNRITYGNWESDTSPFDFVSFNKFPQTCRRFGCSYRGDWTTCYAVILQQGSHLLVVIQRSDNSYIVWHDEIGKAANIQEKWKRWLKLKREAIGAIYLGIRPEEDKTTLTWLSEHIALEDPSSEDDEFLV